MRKKTMFVLIMLLALCSVSLVLASCDPASKEIERIDYESESKTIFWEPVRGAESYTVFENGKELVETSETKFSVSLLKEEVSYITVQPKGKSEKKISDEYLFITKGYDGIEYTLLEDGSGYHAHLKIKVSVGTVISVQSVYNDLPVKSAYIVATNGIKVIPDCIEVYEVYSPNGSNKEGTIRLPQNLKEIKEYPICKAFQINKYGKNFSTQDGVLYDNTMETLVYYPYFKKDSFFVVPESVKTILDIQNEYITEIKLPSKLKKIDSFPPNLRGELSIPGSVKDFNYNIYTFYGNKLIFEKGFQYVQCGFIILNDCDVYIPISVIYIPEELVATNIFNEDYRVTIHCAAKQKPTRWADNWQYGCEVIWGENW